MTKTTIKIFGLSSAIAAALCSQSVLAEDVHKVFGQMNITMDSSSEKGPGAEEGTGINSNAGSYTKLLYSMKGLARILRLLSFVTHSSA